MNSKKLIILLLIFVLKLWTIMIKKLIKLLIKCNKKKQIINNLKFRLKKF